MQEQSWFIRIYYTNRLVLGFLCAGNEGALNTTSRCVRFLTLLLSGFFALLYLMHFWAGPLIQLGPLAPLAAQLGGVNGQLPLVTAFTFFLCFPVMCVKQFMNLVQLKQAAIDIVYELDEKELAAKTATSKKKK